MTTAEDSVRVMIAGGGTGGHLFPGLAVAEEVMARDTEHVVGFVGTARGIEARLVPEAGYDLSLLDVIRLKGGGLLGWIRGLLRLPKALLQSLRILRSFAPDVVVGVGGYASGPLVLMAALTGRRTMVLEQNAVAGFTNRILGRFADRVVLTFEQAGSAFPSRKVRALGNPIRRTIREAICGATPLADEQAGEAMRVLVFGGSQGARALNQTLPKVFAAVERPLEILHQTGSADHDAVSQSYAELELKAEVTEFITDMAGAYAWCDLAICRAGATSVCELAVAGVPSLLVPFPFAADDHQTANATALVEAGAALMVPQHSMEVQSLALRLRELEADRGRLQRMAEAARGLGRPEAAQAVVDEIEALVDGGTGERA